MRRKEPFCDKVADLYFFDRMKQVLRIVMSCNCCVLLGKKDGGYDVLKETGIFDRRIQVD